MEKRWDNSESLGYYNLARGLGMMLIVLGHSMNPVLPKVRSSYPFQGAGTVLGGGIIAAFFMISGFGFYKRTPKKCFKIQKKILLKPYAMVAAAVLLTKVLLAILKKRSFLKNGGELILTYLLGLNAEGGGNLMGIPVESVSILWFILALFGGWNIYNAIAWIKSVQLQRLLTIGCVIVGYLLTRITVVWPFCFPMALLAAGYLAVGERIRKAHLLNEKLPFGWWIIIIALTLFSAAFGEVNIVACVWRLGFIDVAATFCTGFLLLRFYARVMQHDWNGKIVRLLEEAGFYSIWIVCLHAYEKIIFPWYRLNRMFPEKPWLAVTLCFFGRCAVMYVLYLIVSGIYRKWKRKRRCVI